MARVAFEHAGRSTRRDAGARRLTEIGGRRFMVLVGPSAGQDDRARMVAGSSDQRGAIRIGDKVVKRSSRASATWRWSSRTTRSYRHDVYPNMASIEAAQTPPSEIRRASGDGRVLGIVELARQKRVQFSGGSCRVAMAGHHPDPQAFLMDRAALESRREAPSPDARGDPRIQREVNATRSTSPTTRSSDDEWANRVAVLRKGACSRSPPATAVRKPDDLSSQLHRQPRDESRPGPSRAAGRGSSAVSATSARTARAGRGRTPDSAPTWQTIGSAQAEPCTTRAHHGAEAGRKLRAESSRRSCSARSCSPPEVRCTVVTERCSRSRGRRPGRERGPARGGTRAAFVFVGPLRTPARRACRRRGRRRRWTRTSALFRPRHRAGLGAVSRRANRRQRTRVCQWTSRRQPAQLLGFSLYEARVTSASSAMARRTGKRWQNRGLPSSKVYATLERWSEKDRALGPARHCDPVRLRPAERAHAPSAADFEEPLDYSRRRAALVTSSCAKCSRLRVEAISRTAASSPAARVRSCTSPSGSTTSATSQTS